MLVQNQLKTARLPAFYAVVVFDFQEAKYSKCPLKKRNIINMKLYVILSNLEDFWIVYDMINLV